MPIWVVRAGKNGEHENLALERGVVTIGWGRLPDLSSVSARDVLEELMREKHPAAKPDSGHLCGPF